MDRVARYAKVTAKPGCEDALARRLLDAAEGLRDDPGCVLDLINRQADARQVIWVTEVWRSQADLEASIERLRGSAQVAATLELVDNWEMIELELLGGKQGGSDDGQPLHDQELR